MKNIFVFGPDEFDLAQMRSLERAQNYRFHELCHRRNEKQADNADSGRRLRVETMTHTLLRSNQKGLLMQPFLITIPIQTRHFTICVGPHFWGAIH